MDAGEIFGTSLLAIAAIGSALVLSFELSVAIRKLIIKAVVSLRKQVQELQVHESRSTENPKSP